MTVEMLLALLVGGGGIGGLVGVMLTRKSSKESTDIQLLDRAYKEIERLDVKIDELELELANKHSENQELRNVIQGLRNSVDNLKHEIDELKKGR